MMNEILGFAAGSLVAISVFPQVYKSWKTKSTRDIAISWSLINLAGQVLWVVYGFLISSYSLVIMSGVTLLMNVSMIVLKLRYG
ncbi:MAG: SemiSWEET family transporter [Patescibacteria group bacterium]|nr:SemiSWEET family transporter [Patescibacteria group bacterium]